MEEINFFESCIADAANVMRKQKSDIKFRIYKCEKTKIEELVMDKRIEKRNKTLKPASPKKMPPSPTTNDEINSDL